MSKSIAIPSTNQLHESAPALAARFRKHHTEGDFTLDVDLSTPAGFTILFGASGAGKTTLLDCIAGLASPDAGTIQVGS
jgi:molybdate transport system ATP-binding protein